MNKIFAISDKKYLKYVKYFSLMENDKLLQIANIKVENYLKDNFITNTDIFLEKCTQKYLDIYYIDLLSKFIFKKSLARFKLNLIIALHESDFENFNYMIVNSNLIKSFYDILIFSFVLITSPLWLLSKLVQSKLNN